MVGLVLTTEPDFPEQNLIEGSQWISQLVSLDIFPWKEFLHPFRHSFGRSTNTVEHLPSARHCSEHWSYSREKHCHRGYIITSQWGIISAHPILISSDEIHNPLSELLGERLVCWKFWNFFLKDKMGHMIT